MLGAVSQPSAKAPAGLLLPSGSDTAGQDQWIEDVRRHMKGYWITRSGKLSVTYHVPGFWEQFCAFFRQESWVPYER